MPLSPKDYSDSSRERETTAMRPIGPIISSDPVEPRCPMKFSKYHALGNDYIVMNPADFPDGEEPSAAQIRIICHRNFGVGSDGILWGPLPSRTCDYGLRIFNPDGSEAEKSGNGLRIFARYLWDNRTTQLSRFTIETLGGTVGIELLHQARLISVEMGKVSFQSALISVRGTDREVINETLTAKDRTFTFCAATIGNPHCVIPLAEISAALAKTYGSAIETNPLFPQKINVQFMHVIDRSNIKIEIWERGAGYTLASGSSSSAAAAVAHKLGLVDEKISVHMPGGTIKIEIATDYSIRMTGTVNQVATGVMMPELFEVSV
jgi:diaminopimelate epimerase